MTTTRPRAWLIALLLAVVALIAACGGSDDSSKDATTAAATSAAGDTSSATSAATDAGIVLGAAGTEGKGAAAIPADALAFVSVNIDRESDGWKKFIEVASRFPGFAQVAADFQKQITAPSGDGTDFATDIEPWLGGEIAIGVLAVDISDPSQAKPQIAVYIDSKDDAAAVAAIEKGGKAKPQPDYNGYKVFADESGSDPMWAGVGDGAVIISTSQADLERAIDTRAGDASASLAGSADFSETLGKLPQDNMAVVWVNGAKIADLAKAGVAAAQAQASNATGTAAAAAQSLGALQGQLDKSLAQLAQIKGIAMSFGAEDAGFRLRTVALADPSLIAQQGAVFKPTLIDRVPSDAVAYVGFKDLGKALLPQIDALLAAQPDAAQQLEQAEAVLGLSVKDDVIPMLLNEHAIFVGPGVPLGAGLLLTPTDPANAAKVMTQLVALASQAQPGVTTTAVPGGQQVDVNGMSLYWRQVDDVLAISNVATAGDKPAESLAQSPTYQAALEAAGTPDEVSQLLYVDVPGAIGLGKTTGATYSAEADANLAPLASIVAWAESADDTMSADVFVNVKG